MHGSSKVNPVPRASGYLYGFFQNGTAVWENWHNEHKLSSNGEYGIWPGSGGHNKLKPGDVQVWVRAMVNGKWTDATIITIHLTKPVQQNNNSSNNNSQQQQNNNSNNNNSSNNSVPNPVCIYVPGSGGRCN